MILIIYLLSLVDKSTTKIWKLLYNYIHAPQRINRNDLKVQCEGFSGI